MGKKTLDSFSNDEIRKLFFEVAGRIVWKSAHAGAKVRKLDIVRAVCDQLERRGLQPVQRLHPNATTGTYAAIASHFRGFVAEHRGFLRATRDDILVLKVAG